MTAKNKTTPKPATKPKHTVDVKCSKDDNPDDAVAETLTRPVVQAARTIQRWESEYNVASLALTLSQQVEGVKNGDMSRPEAMLLAQAHTLDELFNNLARRAHCQEQMKHYETFLRLALKAQGQCRSTLETLAAIKNPPVIFAKQANISNGHQQINNGTPAPATRTEEIINQQNELLEQTHGERLDSRATSEAIGVNSKLEAVG
ncbi:MAG: hypothetical protein M0Q44_22215 [Methylobacter sp.]|jgi:hypothetical protein|nr:hypothetical protein [Methylobacter sp.]